LFLERPRGWEGGARGRAVSVVAVTKKLGGNRRLRPPAPGLGRARWYAIGRIGQRTARRGTARSAHRTFADQNQYSGL
jgi:hypothetical protein